MMKVQAFSRLLELDSKIQEFSKMREDELVKIKNTYQNKKQELIKEYSRKMEEDISKNVTRIIKQGEEQAREIQIKTQEQLEQMERNFKKYQDDIENEVLKRILGVKRENDG